MDITAVCPVCVKEILLENINSHVDECLLSVESAAQGLPHSSSSEALKSVIGVSAAKPKLTSPKSGKQSVLCFSKSGPHLTTTLTSSSGEEPPAKCRKLDVEGTSNTLQATYGHLRSMIVELIYQPVGCIITFWNPHWKMLMPYCWHKEQFLRGQILDQHANRKDCSLWFFIELGSLFLQSFYSSLEGAMKLKFASLYSS